MTIINNSNTNKFTPSIRFRGFLDPWHTVQLSNIFKEYSEKNLNNIYKPVAVGKNGIRNREEIYYFELADDYSNNKIIKKNTMVIGMGTTQIDFGFLKEDKVYSVSPAYHTFNIDKQYDVYYLENLFKNKNKEYSYKYMITGARQGKSVNIKELLEFCDGPNFKPSIRFKGFEDAWEEKRLGEIIQIVMGQSPDGSTYSDEPSEYILVQGNADLNNGWVCPRVWTTQKTKTCSSGDLIMSVRAPAGAIGKTKFDAVIGRGVASIKGNEFIFQQLYKMDMEGYWKKDSTGSTFESLNSDTIKNAKFKLPSLKEQQKIGKFFEKLDELIALESKKSEKLRNIKSSLLAKLFCKGPNLKPSIRFKGLKMRGKKRKLNIYVLLQQGKSNTQDQDEDGKYPFYIRSDIPVRSNKYLYDEEAVITIGDGNIGKVFHYVNGKFDLHQRCYKMSDFKEIVAKYYYYYFSTKFYKRAMSMTAKATVDSVRLEMISDMNVQFPKDLIEQQKIGKFFEKLDELITLESKKSEKLRNIKSSLLNSMFC